MIGVGDLVVCVDFTSPDSDLENPPLVEGRIYQVARAQPCSCCGEPCLGIEESIWNAAYYARRFRPIDKREPCEIEFVELLNRSKRRVAADV